MALFYPRFVVNEYNPVFRLLDDFQAASRPNRCGGARFAKKQRAFQPRFDVTETKESYELKGELPGIDQRNIEVAFTDEHTLVIKGHTESRREESTPQVAQAEQEKVTAGDQSENAPASESDDASSYHKASVEDEYVDVSESDTTMSGGNPEAAEAPKEVTSEEPQQQPQTSAPSQADREPKRWVHISERSSGSFSRQWKFGARVDQENVSASLKDGILSITIPKATLPENRRIAIQ